MSLLGSDDKTVIKAAAQDISAIAALEIPKGQWTELIEEMAKHSGSDNDNVRLAALQCLGFICEDLDPEFMDPNSLNLILGSVLQNFIPEKIELTRIAVGAFARAAPVTKANFEVLEQRQYIMENILQASKINDDEILCTLMKALIDIGRVNYDHIFDYIQQIGEMTVLFINSDKEEVAKLVVEFWTTLCEVEYERSQKSQPCQNII